MRPAIPQPRSGICLKSRCAILFPRLSQRISKLSSSKGNRYHNPIHRCLLLIPNVYPRIGVPSLNPSCQTESTSYLRIFIASRSEKSVAAVAMAMKDISLKHFSGTPACALSYPIITDQCQPYRLPLLSRHPYGGPKAFPRFLSRVDKTVRPQRDDQPHRRPKHDPLLQHRQPAAIRGAQASR